MYDEAKEKKEQMDDFRVEVRNFLTSSSSFLSLASSLSSESNLSNSLEEQSVPHFSTLDAKSLSPDRGVCRCTRTWRSQTCLNFKVVEEGTHENSNSSLHACGSRQGCCMFPCLLNFTRVYVQLYIVLLDKRTCK